MELEYNFCPAFVSKLYPFQEGLVVLKTKKMILIQEKIVNFGFKRGGELENFLDCAFLFLFFTKLHASYHKNKCKSKEMMVAAMQQAIFS